MRKVKALAKLVPAIGLTLVAAEARAQLIYDSFQYTSGQEVGKQGANFTDGGFVNPQNGFKWFDTDSNATTFVGTTAGDVAGPVGGVAASGNGSVSATGGVISRSPRLQVAGSGLKTGAAYYSLNLNVPDLAGLPVGAAGAFIAGFNNNFGTQTTAAGTVGARLCIRRDPSDSTKFQMGVDNASMRLFDTSNSYSPGTALFIVGKLDVNANPDAGSIWVNPNSSTFGAGDAPAPNITVSQDFASGANSQIGSFFVRADNASVPNFTIDEARVDTTWAQVTPPTGNTWNGANGDSWTDSTKWSAASVPNAGGTFVNFTGAGGTVSIGTGQTIGTITFRTTNSYTLAGAGPLTFDGNRPATADVDGVGDINVLPVLDNTTNAILASSHEIAAPIVINNAGTVDQGGLTLNVGSKQTLTLSGVISAAPGAGYLAETGAGTVVLSNAANSFTSGVRVVGGALMAMNDGALGTAPASPATNIRLRTGGSLKFGAAFTLNPNRTILIENYQNSQGFPNQGTIDTNGFDITLPNLISTTDSSGGTLVKVGSGTLTLTNPSNGQFTNIIQGGTLSIDSDSELGNVTGSITLGQGGGIRVTNSMSWSHGVVMGNGGGSIDTVGNTLTLSGAISGSNNQLTKLGSGTLVLATASTNFVNGPLNVNNGVVQLGPGQTTALSNATVNIAVANGLDLNGNAATLGGLSGTGSLIIPADLTVGNNSQTTTFSGATTGAGGLIKVGSGNLTFAGTQGYTGNTTVTLGKLVLATNLTKSPSVTINSTMELAAGGGSARVLKTGTLTLGPTGILNIQDNKSILSNVPVGTWNGAAYTDATGLVASGRGSGNLWDGTTGIVTGQSAAIGSNFTSIGVAKASDVRPATATATGTWAGQTITGTDTLVMYTYGGDATLDGKINVDDYIKIDSGIAAGLTGWSNGDFNYDGKVNIDDYTQFIDANIGTQGAPFPTAGGVGGGASGVSAVPEPASVALFALGGLGWLGQRPRRKRREN